VNVTVRFAGWAIDSRAMDTGDVIVALVVVAALTFDFTNGFHDTANAMATTIATGALKPRIAVGIAAILNFAGAFISITVAATVAKGIVNAGVVTPTVIFAGLIGAIAWNLITWWFGVPSSSSHALIGGMLGSAIAAIGTSAVEWDGVLSKVIVPALIAPVLAGVVALGATVIVYRLIRNFARDRAERGFRWAQVASSSMVALAHGTNDAQKTMGVISLALIANGNLSSNNFHVPDWVVFSCATAIALGTYTGGWRIIKTLGTKVTEVRAPQGFSSEEVAATVILASSHFGYPLSTTHVVSGAVTGSGVGRPGAQVDWAIARRIVTGWVLTLPAAGLTAAIVFEITDIFGTDSAVGPAAVTVILAIACFFLWRANKASQVEPEEVVISEPEPEPEPAPALEPVGV
jgi:inorganic phosphate transporter, PiT family